MTTCQTLRAKSWYFFISFSPTGHMFYSTFSWISFGGKRGVGSGKIKYRMNFEIEPRKLAVFGH